MSRLAQTYIHLGNYGQALECQKEAFACYQQLGDHYSAFHCRIEIGFLYTQLTRFREAREILTESLSWSRKLGTRPDEGHALLALGGLHFFEGDYVAAIRCYIEAMEILQPLRNPHLVVTLETALGFACYHLGDLAQSREWLEHGLKSARSLGHRLRVAQAEEQMRLADEILRARSDHPHLL